MLALRLRNLWLIFMLLLLGGCGYLPQITRQPSVFNPFPQLTTVAVVPFFNHSAEPTADGRAFALAYAAELQNVPGFEVVPLDALPQLLPCRRPNGLVGLNVNLERRSLQRKLAMLVHDG